MKHVYLDMNIYNRPHDDQLQPHEIRDYMTMQDELFKEVTVDELFERARQHQIQKATLSKADQNQ